MMQSRPVTVVCLIVAFAAVLLLALTSFAEPPVAAVRDERHSAMNDAELVSSHSSTNTAVSTPPPPHAIATHSERTPPAHTGSAVQLEETDGRPPRTDTNYRRDIAKFFALAPGKIEFKDLERHIDLNPRDQLLDNEQRDALEEIIERNQQLITAARHVRMDKRHAMVKELDRKGALNELSLDTVDPATRTDVLAKAKHHVDTFKNYALDRQVAGNEPPPTNPEKTALQRAIRSHLLASARDIVPDAHAFLMREGKLLIANNTQMADLEEASEGVTSARRAFLCETLAWFVAEGLSTPERATLIVEKFEAWIRKSEPAFK